VSLCPRLDLYRFIRFCRAYSVVTNTTLTRIRMPTAGVAFGGTGPCSYRVRSVDGSSAKYLTVESYTVVMLLTVILIIISIPSPLTLSFQA